MDRSYYRRSDVPCPDEQILLALCRGELDGRELDSVTEHLSHCDECRVAVAAAAGASPPRSPRSIGRFAISEVAGHGAMGVVYRGRDSRLGRDVALKVIRASALAGDNRARLEREARNLARVDHPNVVGVYEVGDAEDGELYVAMELVAGPTLGQWLAATNRRPSEILARFAAAGRGLAAAHAAGLVHRDFKPANVLIDPNGVVKVADFGLADDSGAPADPSIDAGDPGAVALTQTGVVLGTPAYMAPEQLRTGAATARSDQFSFCVALFEALAGHRPFAGDDVAALRRSLEAGQPLEPRRPIDRHVYRALRRGLATRPEDRFESMDALLEALGPTRRGGLWIGVAAAAAAVTAVAAIALATGDDSPCAGAGDRWRAVWTQQRRAAIGAAIEAGWPAEPPAGTRAEMAGRWDKLGGVKARLELDGVRRFGDQWRSRYRATCTDSSSPTSNEARLRRQCLDDVLDRLEARLAEPSAARFDRSINEVREQMERCATHLVAALERPADEVFDAVAGARRRLAEAAAGRLVDQHDRAERAAREAISVAESTGFAPLAAEAWLELAGIARDRGDSAVAIEANRKALAAAQSSSHYQVIRRASDNLAWHSMFGLNDAVETRRWLETSRQLDGKVPQTAHERVLRKILEGQLLREDGDLDAAIAIVREASELAEASKLSAEVRARAIEALVLLLIRADDLDAASRTLDQLAGRIDSVSRMVLVGYRAHVALFRGDHAGAAAGYEEAAWLEHTPEKSAWFLVRAGSARTDLGDHSAAERLFDRALAASDTAAIRRAVACGRADDLEAQKDYDRAIAERRRCFALHETDSGPLAEQTLSAMTNLARLYRERGDARLAIDYLERALERYGRLPRPTYGLHTTRYELARLIAATDRRRAIELATAAERGLRPDNPATADGVAAWIRSARR